MPPADARIHCIACFVDIALRFLSAFMPLRILSAADLRRVLPMTAAIAAMRTAFAEVAAGTAQVPLRTALSTPHGLSLFMPGYLAQSRGLAQKVVSVYNGNPAQGLPAITGLVIVLDPVTGLPRGLMDGGTLTAIRTGAAAGLATELLARPESHILALFGAGGMAYDQVWAVAAVRPLTEIRIVSRHGESARRLAARLQEEGLPAQAVADPAAAVRGADIVSCITPSRTPLFADADIAPGTHLNLSGAYTPEMVEAPAATIVRSRIFVDQVEACMAEAGDLLQPLAAGLITADHFRTTLGDVILGRAAGRRTATEITVFKSVGLAAQDVAAACLALARAEAEGIGTLVELF